MEDTGWRRNTKTGGWFNINDIKDSSKAPTNKYMNDKIRSSIKKKNENKSYSLTDENLQQVINESISNYDDNYAKLYMTKISPDDFLELTTSDTQWGNIKDESRELDLPKIQNTRYVADMMYLDLDMNTGEVLGHEGRHRMMAFRNAGYKEVDIVVWPKNYDKYNTKEYTNKKITAQEGTGFASKYKDYSVILEKLVPVSKKNIDRIKKRDY